MSLIVFAKKLCRPSRRRFAQGFTTTLPVICVLLWSLAAPLPVDAEKAAEPLLQQTSTFSGLELRTLGPAWQSGRIADIAVDPSDRSTWYVAVASGGVWKTTNAGTTWTPIFDDQPSYSIGCVTVDPKDPNVVWVGTGENNSQRSVGWGDGVYKSLDGGQRLATHGSRKKRAHRQNRARSAELRHRVGGGPGTSVGGRRRPRALSLERRW